jgi:hypothetical protein
MPPQKRKVPRHNSPSNCYLVRGHGLKAVAAAAPGVRVVAVRVCCDRDVGKFFSCAEVGERSLDVGLVAGPREPRHGAHLGKGRKEEPSLENVHNKFSLEWSKKRRECSATQKFVKNRICVNPLNLLLDQADPVRFGRGDDELDGGRKTSIGSMRKQN